MKHPLFKKVRLFVLASVLGCAVVVSAAVWRSSAFKDSDKAVMKQQFHARLRDGVGREVRLPASGSSPAEIRAATNSMASFIARRSGVNLTESTQERLAALEQKVEIGDERRLSVGELSGVINATVLERLSTFSDQDLAHIDDTLRGFNAPDFPQNIDRDFKLPGGIVFLGTSREKTIGRLRTVRDQLSTPAGEVFSGMARGVIRGRVQSLAQHLSEAVPEQFGNMWDVANDRENTTAAGGITPLQAVLVAYALASDDYLSDSQDSLRSRMKAHQKSLTKASGRQYPAPEGHYAYGVNGYIFSSPLDLVFDERTVNRLLDHIEERGVAR